MHMLSQNKAMQKKKKKSATLRHIFFAQEKESKGGGQKCGDSCGQHHAGLCKPWSPEQSL